MRVAALGLGGQRLAAQGRGSLEVHGGGGLQVQLGQQQATVERVGVFVEDFIDGEFGFAGKTAKGEEPRFEEASLWPLARRSWQFVEAAARALPAALAE